LREIDVAQADFIGLRFVRPAETLFGHATILLGRYHHALPYSSTRERIISSSRQALKLFVLAVCGPPQV
jgi:hypothetical protein